MDVWNVFQYATTDPWGISPGSVIEICKVLEIKDVEECLYKITIINKELNVESDKKKKGKEAPIFPSKR
jgi:hypothetical protein